MIEPKLTDWECYEVFANTIMEQEIFWSTYTSKDKQGSFVQIVHPIWNKTKDFRVVWFTLENTFDYFEKAASKTVLDSDYETYVKFIYISKMFSDIRSLFIKRNEDVVPTGTYHFDYIFREFFQEKFRNFVESLSSITVSLENIKELREVVDSLKENGNELTDFEYNESMYDLYFWIDNTLEEAIYKIYQKQSLEKSKLLIDIIYGSWITFKFALMFREKIIEVYEKELNTEILSSKVILDGEHEKWEDEGIILEEVEEIFKKSKKN
ncbi:hypothetical protein [Spiroplasma endosymbiont of Crioceris asparagi]|uniref:hypothetical protein n=1 Tax=Spiroplasma endosymbiont of Crioceris asparagi TaxID=3066286 RepID=UPI0030CC747A